MTKTKEMTLAKIMEQMQEKRSFIEVPNTEYDPVTRQGIPGLNIAKAEAREALERLEAQYLNRLGEVCARVFCVGGTAEQVQKLRLAAEQHAVVVNADTLFQMIAEKCMPFTGNPVRFTTTASMIMRDELAKAYLRYCPDSEFPRVEPQFFDEQLGDDPVTARQKLASIVKRASKLTAKKPLAVTYAREIAARLAFDLKVSDEPVAIVVVGIDPDDLPDFDANFFPGRPSEVIEVDKVKNAEGALNAVGKKLEKKMAAT